MKNIDIQENVALAGLATFGIGGEARWFVEVMNEIQLREALEFAQSRQLKYFILAGGSNVLFDDDGFDGLVIKIGFNDWKIDDFGLLEVGAGYDLLEMIENCAKSGWGGWEAMAGIPGTIGGAVRGNAGAFGTEIKDVIVSVRALDTVGGEVREFRLEECQFEYRNSFFKQNPQWMILSTIINLRKVQSVEGLRKIKETIAEREKRHLQDVACAGSFFANPVVSVDLQKQFETEKNVICRGGRVPAGWLIQKVGLKGKQIGGAQSSSQHPNYIINTGDATAEHIIMLSSHIKQRVRDQFGVQLQEEVTMVF